MCLHTFFSGIFYIYLNITKMPPKRSAKKAPGKAQAETAGLGKRVRTKPEAFVSYDGMKEKKEKTLEAKMEGMRVDDEDEAPEPKPQKKKAKAVANKRVKQKGKKSTGAQQISTFRAGLHAMPVGRIHKILEDGKYCNRISKFASVFMAGLLEHIITDALVGTIDLNNASKRVALNPKALHTTLGLAHQDKVVLPPRSGKSYGVYNVFFRASQYNPLLSTQDDEGKKCAVPLSVPDTNVELLKWENLLAKKDKDKDKVKADLETFHKKMEGYTCYQYTLHDKDHKLNARIKKVIEHIRPYTPATDRLARTLGGMPASGKGSRGAVVTLGGFKPGDDNH